ncbi:hypothetical protein CY34DRAFT_38319, partial [Suillus luteus UH-Slu-Lm8-n1]
RIVTASHDGMLRLWDRKTGVMLKKMEGHRSRVRALAVSPNGLLIASSDESGGLMAWHGQTGECVQVIKAIDETHNGWILSLDFSPTSGMLASGSSDTYIELWSTSNWQQQHRINCGGIVHCVRFQWCYPNYLAIATDHDIQIYNNFERGSRTLLGTSGRGFGYYSLAWTSSARLLSGGNRTNPTIREWDITSTSGWPQLIIFKQVGDPWKGHFESIRALSLNSNRTLLASASDDNRVRLWRLSDRRTIAIYKHSGGVNCATFSKDDGHIFSGGADKKISEW